MLRRLGLAVLLLAAPRVAAQDVAAGSADAVARQRAAVAAAEAEHGADSLAAAAQLLKLGQLLAAQSEYGEALPVHRRVLAIREARLPADHAQTDVARVNVAGALVALDEPAAAVPLLRAVCEAGARRPPSRLLAGALTNLGVAECKLGDYAAATEHLTAAVELFRRHFPDHTFAATAMQNLAQVRLNQGRVEQARQLIAETIAVLERTDPEGPRHAHALFGMGLALARAERVDEAMAVMQRSLAIWGTARQAGHAQRRECDYQLGWLACQRGDLDAARDHLERSLAPAGTPPSTSQVRCHATLARTLVRLGELDGARRHEAAATQLARLLRIPRPQCVDLLFCRAELAAADGGPQQAVPLWREALAAVDGVDPETALAARSALARALFDGGDLATAAGELRTNLRSFGATVTQVLPAMFEAERLRYVAEHRRDLDLLLECLTTRTPSIEVADAYAAVLAWKGQVARGVHDCLDRAHANVDDVPRLRRLREIASEAAQGRADASLRSERERLLAAIGGERPSAAPDPEPAAIQAVLGANEALIDYVHWRRRDGEQRLLAFVVTGERVDVRDLGGADGVAHAIAQHVLMTSRSVAAGAEQFAREGALGARAVVFDRAADAIGARRRLWVCPDGAVATLPFETLPGPADGSYLIEQYTIDYLQSAAQLLAPARAPAAEAVVAFGAVDYGAAPEPGAAAPRGASRPFAPLPHTEVEVAAIARAAGDGVCRIVRAADATEARLRELSATATVLHLATHGYYGGPDDRDAAGIALAAANRAADGDDGILSVGEAGLLDLQACRLVVLSACQSGLGTPFAGESLLGLRRSLHLAGAACTITSLWAVGDRSTADLMVDFYELLLQRGATPGAALRQAKLRALARARAACGEGLPGRWGAFVCEGR